MKHAKFKKYEKACHLGKKRKVYFQNKAKQLTVLNKTMTKYTLTTVMVKLQKSAIIKNHDFYAIQKLSMIP